MQRYIPHLLSFILALTVASNASALDSFYIATEDYTGQKQIKVFSASGDLTSSISINNKYSNAYFLAGKWNRADDAIVALHGKTKNLNVSLINRDGSSSRSKSLGKDVVQVLALDYNNNGLSDLVVQYKTNPVKIFFDFGDLSKDVSTGRFNASAKADIVTVQTSAGAKLGNLKLNPYNRNFPNSFDQAKNAVTNYKSGNFIQAPNSKGQKKKIIVKTDAHNIYPVLINNKSGFIVQSTAKNLNLIGDGLKRVNYTKSPKATFFSGFYTSDTNSSLVIGNPLDVNTGTAKVKLIDPLTKSTKDITLNINQTKFGMLQAKKASEKVCNWLKAFVEAINKGNLVEAKRLYKLIVASGEDVSTCEDNGGNNNNDNDDDDNNNNYDDPDDDPTFSANAIQYLAPILRLGSNTGMGATPCAYIKDARDGKGRGFLAKNSDTHPGTVYLVPGYYTNGRVLNANSFKQMYKTTFTGIANGGRSHFRLYSKRLPFGPHIFIAEQSGIPICWKVPGSSSRVD